MKRFIPTLLSLSTLLAIPQPATAKNITAQTAAQQKTSIAVELGAGHTIDFSQTGEAIFRAWVGDGGRCLQLSPSSPFETGASILYLRRISPCQQITGLPAVNITTLTLVSMTPAGATNIYEFEIDYSATGDSITRLLPSTERTPVEQSPINIAQLLQLDTGAITAGLSTFDMASDSPMALRVQAWLSAIEEGQSQRAAARYVDIDWALLQRLETLGKTAAPAAPPVAPPVAPAAPETEVVKT